MTRLYLTDQQARAAGLDPTLPNVQQRLQDAADLYSYIDASQPAVTRAQLDKWAIAQWGPSNPAPDDPGTVNRLNQALDLLVQAGRVYGIDATLKALDTVTAA